MGKVVQRNNIVYVDTGRGLYCFDLKGQVIGEGAMGVVYFGRSLPRTKAESVTFVTERVAIKAVKHPYYRVESIRERARLEANLMFNHKNVIKMLGSAEVNPTDGPIFIVSEFVDGCNIDRYVNTIQEPDVFKRAVMISYLIADMLEGLSHVHSFRIEHRDIKPSNIKVSSDGNVKLMDLGIARLNGGNKYSVLGFVGTPQYAAPEQIMRTSAVSNFSPLADIYSAGVTLYELITGVNPFDDPVDTAVLEKQIRMTLPMDKRIPKQLYSIIRKATQKHPEERYGSAMEFRAALLDFAKTPSPSRPVNPIIIFSIIAIVAILLIIFLILL